MNRKQFLKLSFSISTSLIASSYQKLFSEDKKNNIPPPRKIPPQSVLILGGGLSGLYAGYLLKKRGWKIKIIESTNRLGGRILSYTIPNTNTIVELGGEYIGEKQSTIRSLARELDISLVLPQWERQDSLWDNSKLSEKSRTSLEKLLNLQSILPPEQIQGLDRISAYRYLQYQGFQLNELEDLEKVVRAFYGESSKNISAYFLLACIESNRSYFQKLYRVEGGAETFIQKLKSFYNDDEIVLGEKAEKVTYNSNSVQVECSSGTTLRARHLVCTLPAYSVYELDWQPNLPREKIFALLRVSYGKIHKEIVSLESNPSSPVVGNGIVDWIFPQKDNYATILISGNKTQSIQSSTPSMAKDLIYRSLTAYSPITIETIQTPRIGFGEGAVSYMAPSNYGIREILETSVGPIHFAGEHLAEIPGTMDAALVSAFRAVTRIP